MGDATETAPATEPIAIVGFSFKFGGEANNTQSFWDMLVAGDCAVTDVPTDRFNADSFYHPDTDRLDTLPVKRGNFLKENIAAFDAPFFSIKAAEAAAMDPQSRALLEATYRPLENAGIPIEKCAGTRTCVYTGVSADDYRLMYVKDVERTIRHAATGMAISMLANKISWFYDFKGPSTQIDTACSASLNALHLACQSIRCGESIMGVVGGANMFFTPESMAPFDQRANGYSRGEGFGVLILKPLSQAIADGDPIRAIIRATGSNENGRTTGGITKVNREAQESLIRETYLSAGLDFDLTRYAEAHGPGTEGDIVETEAFGEVFKSHRSAEEPLYVGSVKANIGHLEGTSGISSLVKVILMLEEGIIPRLANFEKLHPKILADDWNLRFPMQNEPWPTGTRRASINSFGFGGSNAHVVLDGIHEHPLLAARVSNDSRESPIRGRPLRKAVLEKRPSGNPSMESSDESSRQFKLNSNASPMLLIWSTADEGGMQRLAPMYSKYISQAAGKKDPSCDLKHLAHTLAFYRSRLPWSSFVIARSWSDLSKFETMFSKPVRSITEPKLVLIFNGQGTQYARMGLGLLENGVFRDSLDNFQQHLDKLGVSWDLIEEISRDPEHSKLHQAEYWQPICTALQIALVDLLKSYGVSPSAVLGHSSGEIAAAYSIRALSAESACRIAVYRGILAGKASGAGGKYGMMAVGLSKAEARSQLLMFGCQISEILIDIGCVNSSRNVTLTGDAGQLDLLSTILTEQSIFARRLDVNVAYHSRYMKAISAKYESLIGTLEGPATIQATAQMYSSVTAKSISVEELRTARYWVQNLESPVLFEPALKEMINNIPGIRASLEVGPHGVLRRAIKDTLIEIMRGEKIQCISTLDRNKNAAEAFLESIRKFHCLGFPIDLSQAISLRPGTKVECLTDLPEYPFDHSKTYWHESRLSKSHRFRKFARNDLLGSRVVDWNPLRPRWRNIIRALENPWIEDHRIGGALIYPGAGMLVMAIEAAAQYVRDLDDRQIDGFLLKEVVFLASLNVSLLPDGTETEIHLEPSSEKLGRSAAPARLDFHIYLLENEQWTETCCGKIAVQFREDESIHAHTERLFREKDCLSTLQSRTGICTSSLKNTKLYERFKAFGLDFGPTFQVFEDVRYDPSGGMASAGIKLGTWRLRGNPAHATRYVVHPTALDGALQLPVIALGAGVMKHVPTMVPSKIAWLWVSGCGLHSETQSKTVAAVAKAEYRGFRGTMSEVLVIDPVLQTPKIVIKGLETVIITSESDEENVPSRNMCFRMDWLPDLDMICPESLTRYIRGYTTTYHQVSVAKPDCELSPKKKGLYELERYLAILMHKDSALRMLEVASPSIGDVSDLVLWHLLRRKDGSDAAWDDSFAAYDIGIQREEIPQDLAAAIESISNDKRVGLRTVNVLKNKSARPAHSFKREETVLYGLVVAFLGKSAVMSQSKQFLRFMQPGGRLVIVTSCSISPSLEDIVTDAWLQNLETTRGSVEVELAMSCNVGRSNPIAQDSIALVVLRLVEPKPQQGEPMLSLTLLKMSGEPTDWASLSESLRDGLSRNNSVEVTVLDWKDYSMLNEHENQPQDLDIVCLSVLDATSLKDAGEDAFLALKALVARSKSILWVTCVVKNYNALGAGEECPPLHGMISGVGRTIRTEYPNLILVTLTLDTLINRELGTPSTITEITETILKVHQQMQTSPTHNYEPEYHYTHPNSTTPSLFLIPRLHRSHPLNTALTSSFTTPGPILQPFSTHTSLHLTTTSPGLLSTLLFQPFTPPRPPPPPPTPPPPPPPPPPPLPPTHIRIHPSHTGLNFLDLLTALGRIPHISVLGVEAAGTVTEAGSASDLPRGTRVAVLTDGTLRSSITAHYQTAVRIPDTLSFRDAASIPGTACTVYRALVDVARLQAGEGVLIHAGAGATGQMGIQLARHIGAEVFVTVGSEAKKGLVVETYGVDERNVLFSRDGSFVDGIKRRTGGRGVDVVLNCLSGGLLEEGWEGCVAPFGRWVEIGKRDVMGGSKLNMAPLARNVSFACVDLSGIWRERPSMMRELLENVFRLVVEGALKVVTPIREFSVCDVEGGFRSLQKGEEGGKVVIRMGGEEVVRILLPREPGWSLSWNRTYVICGGLGGLGRSVARWMVERGARHLILISRSGIGNDQVKQALVDELENRGCMVLTPKVDIADTAALAALLQHCATTLPHLAGCIQATMVLRDAHLPLLTLPAWHSALSPKVLGSWNLHTLLPRSLNFFILLSSLVGVVGAEAQANYAAGNTFQDTLAQHRISVGEHAVSLDLGMVLDEGAVAEDEKLGRALSSTGWYRGMKMRELEGLLDMCCDPTTREMVEREGGQIVCGVNLPGTIRAGGHKEPVWMGRPMLRQLHVLDLTSPSTTSASSSAPLSVLISSAPTLQAGTALVIEVLVQKLSASLGIPTVDIDPTRPIHFYGVDSLVALELRSWFAKEVGVDVPVFELLGNGSVDDVVEEALGRSREWGKEGR